MTQQMDDAWLDIDKHICDLEQHEINRRDRYREDVKFIDDMVKRFNIVVDPNGIVDGKWVEKIRVCTYCNRYVDLTFKSNSLTIDFYLKKYKIIVARAIGEGVVTGEYQTRQSLFGIIYSCLLEWMCYADINFK